MHPTSVLRAPALKVRDDASTRSTSVICHPPTHTTVCDPGTYSGRAMRLKMICPVKRMLWNSRTVPAVP